MTALALLAVGYLLGVLTVVLTQNHTEAQMSELRCPGCTFVVSYDTGAEEHARHLMREHDCGGTGEAL